MNSHKTAAHRYRMPARFLLSTLMLPACLLQSFAAVAGDLAIGLDPTAVELQLQGDAADAQAFSARAQFWQDGNALHLRIEVTDHDLVFASDTAQADHVRLWLAPPENRFSDQPQQHFHSELLGQRYWIPPELTEAVLASGGWLGDEHFFADACFRGNDYGNTRTPPDVLLERSPVALGVLRLDINPYGRQVQVHDSGWAADGALHAVAGAVVFEHFELTDFGYAMELLLPPAALGLVPVTGIASQRLAIDVVSFDSWGQQTVRTSAVREREDDAGASQQLRLAQPLLIEVDTQLPFLGRPWRDLPESQQALTTATPPYLIWTDQRWSGARLGPRPGSERGDDFCTAAVGGGLLRYEASFVPEAFTYERHPLAERRLESWQGGLYIDGEPVDLSFTDSDADSGAVDDSFRPRLRQAFAVDADTVALVILHVGRERGRFASGPCAAGTSEYLDLLLWSQAGSRRGPLARHRLARYSTCSGASIGDVELAEDEFGWQGHFDAVHGDDSGRLIELAGTRNLHQWQLRDGEAGWSVDYRMQPSSIEVALQRSAAARLLDQLHADPPPPQAELHQRLLAVLDADAAGFAGHELENTICTVAGDMSLRQQRAIVGRLGHTPACLLRHPRLIDGVAPDRPGAGLRLARVARLIDNWQPPERGAIQEAIAYLEGGQRLHEEGRAPEAEAAYAIAALLARRAGGFPAQRRHLDTNWQPVEHRLLLAANQQTWDFVLEHAVDTAARETLVEYWLAEYGRRQDYPRFEALLASHPLPRDRYRYLLFFSADQPQLRERLLALGVRFDDRLQNGDTLLHLLVQSVYATPAQITLLLANGVEADAIGEDGETALQRLYRYRSTFYQGDAERFLELASALIDADADVRRPGLLSRALQLDARHGRGRPLHFSAPLLAAGADPERLDAEGDSALRYAIRHELGWLIEPLLAAGVDVDNADAEGATALMLALFNGQIDSARLLLAAGADPTRRNAEGRDACDHIGASLSADALDPAMTHALRKSLDCLQRAAQVLPALWQADREGCGQDRFAFSARRDGVWSVYSVHRDGSDLRRIGGERTDRPQRLRVARGSNLIAWQEADGIHVATCTGEEARRVRNDGQLLAWYPDGRRLLILKGLGSALCSLHVDGSVRCTPAYTLMPYIDIAGDGRTLVLNVHQETPSLYEPGVPGALHNLFDRDSVPPGQSNSYARILPDGETVSYVSRSPGQPYQLKLWRPDGGIGETVLEGNDPDRQLWHYAWSADTHTVALIPLSFAQVGVPPRPGVLKLFDRTQGRLQVLDLGFENYSDVNWFW